MYPNTLKVVVSANSVGQPVFTVSISQRLIGETEKSMTITSYSIIAMYMKLRASRTQINTFVDCEAVCYAAGEGNTWDDLIEYLGLLSLMVGAIGGDFATSFKGLWGSFPYVANPTTKHLVREFLSS